MILEKLNRGFAMLKTNDLERQADSENPKRMMSDEDSQFKKMVWQILNERVDKFEYENFKDDGRDTDWSEV